MTQRIIEISSPVFVSEEHLQAGGALNALFAQERPLALEIGCGIGDFIVQIAARRPDLNFLAIDIYNKGCLKTCKRIEAAGLDNVRVCRVEARHLLTRYLSPQSLEAVYVNCPDPWPKKRHRKRRLVNSEFLEVLQKFLSPSGEFFFASDVRDYAEDVGRQVNGHPAYQNCLKESVTTYLPGYPISKYMQRFLDEEQAIHYIHARRKQTADISPESTLQFRAGFRMPPSQRTP